MKTNITASDLAGLPHMLILRSDTEIKVIEFEGPDAMEKAHLAAQRLSDDFQGCITVAARVRQIARPQHAHLGSF